MPVLINFKICDNAKECNGIEVCPTGALSWNEEDQTIEIDNSKCIECGTGKKLGEVECVEEDDFLREHADTVELMGQNKLY